MTFKPKESDLDAAEAGMRAYQTRQMDGRVCTSLRGYAEAALIAIDEANKSEPMSELDPEQIRGMLVHQAHARGETTFNYIDHRRKL